LSHNDIGNNMIILLSHFLKHNILEYSWVFHTNIDFIVLV